MYFKKKSHKNHKIITDQTDQTSDIQHQTKMKGYHLIAMMLMLQYFIISSDNFCHCEIMEATLENSPEEMETGLINYLISLLKNQSAAKNLDSYNQKKQEKELYKFLRFGKAWKYYIKKR